MWKSFKDLVYGLTVLFVNVVALISTWRKRLHARRDAESKTSREEVLVMTLAGIEYRKLQESERSNRAKEIDADLDRVSREQIADKDRTSKETIARQDRQSKESIANLDRQSKATIADLDREASLQATEITGSYRYQAAVDAAADNNQTKKDIANADRTWDLVKTGKANKLKERELDQKLSKDTADTVHKFYDTTVDFGIDALKMLD